MKLIHATAVCSSMTNADRFYREILGLVAVKNFTIEQELTNRLFAENHPCRIILYENDRCAIEVFIPETAPPPRSPYAHLCLDVGDRAAFLTRCREAGIAINQVPKGENTLIFITDYDGNQFEIKGT
ncbi:VOC family protein [Thermodesulfobacteriota bacterium]